MKHFFGALKDILLILIYRITHTMGYPHGGQALPIPARIECQSQQESWWLQRKLMILGVTWGYNQTAWDFRHRFWLVLDYNYKGEPILSWTSHKEFSSEITHPLHTAEDILKGYGRLQGKLKQEELHVGHQT